jgi:hypothetical protein
LGEKVKKEIEMKHSIPGLDARLAYDEANRQFVVEGPDAHKAEGLDIYHPNGFVSNTIRNGVVPSFKGWGASIYGVETPTSPTPQEMAAALRLVPKPPPVLEFPRGWDLAA